MTPEEIARIDWKAAANWAQLITDTRNQSANDTAQLRRTQDNLDWISTWWVQAGAASARFARRKQTFQIALDKLTRQLATSPDYLQEAKTILAQTQLPTVTQDLFNTSTARRIRTDEIGRAYQRLLTCAAIVRDGLRSGEINPTPRTTAAQLNQEQARTTPAAIRNPFRFDASGGWPWGLIIMFGAAALVAMQGRRNG